MSDYPIQPSQSSTASAGQIATLVEDSAKALDNPPTGSGHDRQSVVESVESPPIAIAHVAEPNKRYPGETVRLFTQVRLLQDVDGFTLRVQIPPQLVVEDYRATGTDLLPEIEVGALPPGDEGRLRGMTPGNLVRHAVAVRPEQYLVWRINRTQESGTVYEFVISAYVDSLYRDMSIRSRAGIYVGLGHTTTRVAEETVQISIAAKGSYLTYLPALFEQDDFMGRFLMLFESFWRPLDKQIDSIHNVFDPGLTPAHFLPWLASWFDLDLDENWSESQQRRLLRVIMQLYRKRGTRKALQEWLEIFSGHPVEIREHRSNNFRLGPTARLGAGIALGMGNIPHTFTVRVTLDPVQVATEYADADIDREQERLENRQRRQVVNIIEAEKPAHTRYVLEITRLEHDENGVDNEQDLHHSATGEV